MLLDCNRSTDNDFIIIWRLSSFVLYRSCVVCVCMWVQFVFVQTFFDCMRLCVCAMPFCVYRLLLPAMQEEKEVTAQQILKASTKKANNKKTRRRGKKVKNTKWTKNKTQYNLRKKKTKDKLLNAPHSTCKKGILYLRSHKKKPFCIFPFVAKK